jgi:hypothetical protein
VLLPAYKRCAPQLLTLVYISSASLAQQLPRLALRSIAFFS